MDHVSSCKPRGRDDVAYTAVRDVILKVVAELGE